MADVAGPALRAGPAADEGFERPQAPHEPVEVLTGGEEPVPVATIGHHTLPARWSSIALGEGLQELRVTLRQGVVPLAVWRALGRATAQGPRNARRLRVWEAYGRIASLPDEGPVALVSGDLRKDVDRMVEWCRDAELRRAVETARREWALPGIATPAALYPLHHILEHKKLEELVVSVWKGAVSEARKRSVPTFKTKWRADHYMDDDGAGAPVVAVVDVCNVQRAMEAVGGENAFDADDVWFDAHWSRAIQAIEAVILGALVQGLEMEDVVRGQVPGGWVCRMVRDAFYDSVSGRLEDRWKYELATMAYHRLNATHAGAPARPEWLRPQPHAQGYNAPCPFQGRLRGWWIRLDRAHPDASTEKGLALSNWLLQMKKAFPEIPRFRVDKAVNEWYVTFTTRPAVPQFKPAYEHRSDAGEVPVPGPDNDSLTDIRLREFRDAFGELYRAALGLARPEPGEEPPTADEPGEAALPLPGLKATFESDRAHGATWTEVHDELAYGWQFLTEYATALRGARDDIVARGGAVRPDGGGPGGEPAPAVSTLGLGRPPALVEQANVDTIDGQLRLLAHLLKPTYARVGRMEGPGGATTDVVGMLAPATMELLNARVLSDLADGMVLAPVGLAEAFKVRVISTGRAVAYWASRLVQKHMHGCLRRLPEFELIGLRSDRTIADVIDSVIGPVRLGPAEKDLLMVSGDYKASTDSLREPVSRMAVEEWCRIAGYGEQMSRLVMATMCDNTIHERKDGKGKSAPQVSAQPMGSPVSFPFLCAINWVTSVVGLRHGERRVVPEERPYGRRTIRHSGIVINGDDILFACVKGAQYHWSYSTSAAGLKPSVGKNYLSTHFGNINSAMFRPRPVQVEGPLNADGADVVYNSYHRHLRPDFARPTRWIYIPYVNVSVLRPAKRPELEEFLATGPALQRSWLEGHGASRTLGQCARADQAATRLFSIEVAERLWLGEWEDYLLRLPKGMNWFVARDLGGFGLYTSRLLRHQDTPPTPGVPDVVVTRQQCHVAAYLRDTTQPNALRTSLLRFGSAHAATTCHDDLRHLTSEMEQAGMLRWEVADRWTTPFHASGATQVLGLSAFSEGPAPCTALGWSVLLDRWEVIDTDGAPAPNVKDIIKQLTRSLQRAGTRTPRAMDVADIAGWTPRKLVLAVTPGWKWTDIPLINRVGPLERPANSLTPVRRPPRKGGKLAGYPLWLEAAPHQYLRLLEDVRHVEGEGPPPVEAGAPVV